VKKERHKIYIYRERKREREKERKREREREREREKREILLTSSNATRFQTPSNDSLSTNFVNRSNRCNASDNSLDGDDGTANEEGVE
jgi:hypothetical protein